MKSGRFSTAGCGGASLIEVLVAILVLSLGLLGLPGLKAMSSAQSRALASLQVQDIVDRMRANRARADEGAYDLAAGDAAPGGDTVAAQDLRQWKAALASLLPEGDGSIARSASADAPGHCERADSCFFWITVQWLALGEDDVEVRSDASGSRAVEAEIRARRLQRIVVVAVLCGASAAIR